MTTKDILNYYRKLLKKSRSLCAEYLNLKPIDVFLIIAVIMALAYIVVNRVSVAVSEPKRTTIVISSRGAGLFGRDTVDALIQEFEEQHPELRIQEAAQDAKAAAAAVDIVFFDDGEFGALMNTGALAPSGAYPLVSFMDIFIYNIDILKAANLDRPPKTRAEFLTAARAVAGSGGGAESAVSAFALGLSPSDPLALRRDFYPWLWANGVDIQAIDLSDDPALPRAVMDAIALLGQLKREKLLAPGTLEKTGAQRLQEFAEGKIAMMTASTREITFLLNNAPGVTFGVTALPAITQGKNRLGLSSVYAGVSGSSAVPDEAGILLSFLVEKGNVLAEALSAIPGHLTVGFAGDYVEKSELYSKAWDIYDAAEIVDYQPGQPSGEAFDRLVREKLAEALKD